MNIVILGASGQTGHHILETTLRHGHDITAFVRNANKITTKNSHLRIVQGDATNIADLKRAFAGQDLIISALGNNLDYTFFQTSTAAIVRAAEVAYVPRIIVMSSFIVTNQVGQLTSILFNTLLKRNIADIRKGEALLRSSSLNWTIVYATKLTNGPRTGHIHVVPKGQKVSLANTITREDVAEFIVKSIDNDAYYQKSVIITG